ncbi:MAG TPA: hypothetical protein VIM65_11900 [Cyclobacteriaceae bacterium]
MKKFITILFLTFLCLGLKAQNVKTSTIQWSSIRTIDGSKGENKDEVTTLTNFSTTRFEWTNEDGSLRKTYQIIEVVGNWTNAATPGSLTFEVTDGTSSGTITIRKDDNQNTNVLMVIGTDPQITELTIQSLQAL